MGALITNPGLCSVRSYRAIFWVQVHKMSVTEPLNYRAHLYLLSANQALNSCTSVPHNLGVLLEIPNRIQCKSIAVLQHFSYTKIYYIRVKAEVLHNLRFTNQSFSGSKLITNHISFVKSTTNGIPCPRVTQPIRPSQLGSPPCSGDQNKPAHDLHLQ